MARLEARTFVGGAAVAVALLATTDVQSSTVSGSVSLDFMQGTLAFADPGVPGVPGDPALTMTGDFGTVNSLQNPTGSAPGGWQINSTITYAGQTTSPMARDEDFTDGYGGAGGLRAEYRSNLGLFSIISFMDAIIGQTNPDASASGVFSFGGVIPVNWEISGQNVDMGPPITATGNFMFSIDGTDDARDFLNVFSGFSGAAADLDGNREGGSFTASFTLAPIPIPAALPLLLSGVGLLGFMGWRRRQAQG